ncbi:MAG: hypothetical protein H0X39_00795 [Actinobacteria bacterium]|nr:hypothetical protein [Actinomycetota bacterium]
MTLGKTYSGERGPENFTYLVRVVNGNVVTAHLQSLGPDDDVTPSVVRSLCLKLGINPAEFGALAIDDRN